MLLEVTVVVLLFILSFLSGMLGLGVAFIAIPALGFFNYELKHVIMPWALLLNGLTAIAAALTFMKKKMVDYKTAIPVLLITTAAAPLGVYLLQFASTEFVWWVFVALLIFLAYRMAFPPVMSDVDSTEIPHRKRVHAGIFGVFIGTLAGFLGVGPGFLMMPTLVLLGYTARIAAATNAVIVTLPSFSALAAHLSTAKLNWGLVGISAVVSVIGAQLGAAFMAKRVRSRTLAHIFALALVGLAAYRVILLVTH
ncbi:MAG: sulfite exporter TauE/SafE family protein [candidate division KSB1 bacterium]|nr:sulfite exporter TauE/SafE family protein [candidate division KSB1 bacterium]